MDEVLKDAFSLALRLDGTDIILTDYRPTLAAAIAQLKQSAAEQMRVLGLVAPQYNDGATLQDIWEATKMQGESYQHWLERKLMVAWDKIDHNFNEVESRSHG